VTSGPQQINDVYDIIL